MCVSVGGGGSGGPHVEELAEGGGGAAHERTELADGAKDEELPDRARHRVHQYVPHAAKHTNKSQTRAKQEEQTPQLSVSRDRGRTCA
eukprot:8961848-Pyramimonas_sp.AAC.1